MRNLLHCALLHGEKINDVYYNYPQLKVDYNGDKIPVSISEDPEILVKKKIPEFPKIKIWIKKYSVVLLQHWNKEITDKEALNQLGEY